jgi:MFS family permease
MMVLATLSCFACSVPVSFIRFFVWRFLAGLTGSIIMVLAASLVLPHVSPQKRGIVGGVIFAGVGLGVAASGTLVPLLLHEGLRESWYGLGVLSGLLTLVGWTNWPKQSAAAASVPVPHHPARHRASRAARALLLEYGLNACALVPHMVFIVVHRRFRGAGTWPRHRRRVAILGLLRPRRDRRTAADRPSRRPGRVRAGLARVISDREGSGFAACCQHGGGFPDRIECGHRRVHARHRAAGAGTHP